MDLFNQLLGPQIQWKALRKNSTQLNQPGSQMTKENAELLGQIRTSFLNVFDAYDSTEQTVLEWCSYDASTNARYIQISKQSGEKAYQQRIKLLISILENAIKNGERAQQQLGDISSSNIELDGQLRRLEANLQRDYNENSPYFQKRLDRLLTEESGGMFDRRKNKEQIIAKLKQQLSAILTYYQRLGSVPRFAVDALKQASSQSPNNIQAIKEQKSHVEALLNAPAPASVPADESGPIHSAKILIALCEQYHTVHST